MISFWKSLAFRVFVASFILLALPLFVDSFVIMKARYEETLIEAKRYLVEVNRERALPLTRLLPVKHITPNLIIRFLGLDTNFPSAPSPKLSQRLTQIAEVGDLTGIVLLRHLGEDKFENVAASTNTPINQAEYSEFYRLYLKQATSRREFGLLYESIDGQYFLLFGKTIYGEGGGTTGFLIFIRNVTDSLKELLVKDTSPYPVSFAVVLDNMVVIAATDPALKYNYLNPLTSYQKELFAQVHPTAANRLLGEPLQSCYSYGPPFVEFPFNGQMQFGALLELPGTPFYFLAYSPKDAIFATPYRDFFEVYGAYMVILLCGGLIAYFIIYRLAAPLNRLGEIMKGIQQGKTDLRYEEDPVGFEINHLGSSFNSMLDHLLENKRVAEEEKVKKELYAEELRFGQQMQRSLLPEKKLSFPGVELAERYLPAKEVGGDFYDVFLRNEDELVLVMADASGKGVHACFYSLGVRSSLRVNAHEYDDVARAMRETNLLLYRDSGDTGMFVTVVVAIYNKKTSELRYFSAGHNPPLVRKSDGTVIKLENRGIAMGVIENLEGKSETVKLESGDLVVFYTDGITEQNNEAYELYSEERLIEFIKLEGKKNAHEVTSKLIDQVKAFAGTAPQHDDITLLLMKLT